jgi:hypothetical protein
MEDYPLWLNITKSGHKLYFMDKVTVNYRRHPNAINNTGALFIVNPNYFRTESFRRLYTYPFLPPLVRSEQKFRWTVTQIFRINGLNRSNWFNRAVHKLLTVYLNPSRIIMSLQKRLDISVSDNDYCY